MKKITVYHWTGFAGIFMYLLVLLEIPLYFVYTPTASGTPPNDIILQRIFIDLFICMGLIVFFSGLKTIIAKTQSTQNGVGTLIYSCGLAFSIVAFLADSIQSGSLWAAKGSPVNPTWVSFGAEGALLIYGPVNRLLNTIILLTGSTVIQRINLFPKWTAWCGYLFGVYNLAFVPTIFFMTTPLDFYSVNGWNIPIAAGLFFLWIFIISIFLVRTKSA